MLGLPDFDITSKGEISTAFVSRDLSTFYQAISFIKNLNYGRNANNDDLKTVFTDNKGTCSTKHALLKELATENGIEEIRLMLGIFKMSGTNTPKVLGTLSKHGLSYVPEAHIYLRYDTAIFDFTNPASSPADFADDLLYETEIRPDEITAPKVKAHKTFLAQWLEENKDIGYSLDELWNIRERCISDLSL